MKETSCKLSESCPVMCETTPKENKIYNENRCNVDCIWYSSNGTEPQSVTDNRPHKFDINGKKVILTSEQIKQRIIKRLRRQQQIVGLKGPKKGSNFTKKKRKRKKKR